MHGESHEPENAVVKHVVALPMIWLLAGASLAGQLEIPSVVISAIEQVDVPARQHGALSSLAVEEGTAVAEGQLLATIDEGDAQLARRRAELNLESARDEAANQVAVDLARKSLQLAQSELDRGRRSRQRFQDSISEEELEARQLRVDRAQLEVKQAEHELRIAQNKVRFSENELLIAQRQLERHRIVAPLSGIIVQMDQHGGEWVEPGQRVCRILRLNRLRAEGFVDAHDLPPGCVGSAVTLVVRSGAKSREFTGKLKFISPEINPVDGRVRVWAEIDNSELALRPGMRGALTIQWDPAHE
jgi:macrolide-specific efflux system membrane fusion protein